MSSNTILWISTFVLLLGGAGILLKGKQRTSSETMQTMLHGTVPIIAACFYFLMATGQGQIMLPTDTAVAGGPVAGRLLYFARSIDWMFTTPLLLLSLGLAATHSGPKRPDLLTGAVIADLIMIASAFAFSASEVGWMKWSWFIVSCVAFLGVYYVLWVTQLQATRLEREAVQVKYRREAMILSGLWFAYPVILAVAPDGLNIVSDAFAVLVIAILDVLSKVVYGFISIASDEKLVDHDLAATPAMAASRA